MHEFGIGAVAETLKQTAEITRTGLAEAWDRYITGTIKGQYSFEEVNEYITVSEKMHELEMESQRTGLKNDKLLEFRQDKYGWPKLKIKAVAHTLRDQVKIMTCDLATAWELYIHDIIKSQFSYEQIKEYIEKEDKNGNSKESKV